SPPPRYGMAMATDAKRGRTVMFGGTDTYTSTWFGDTWEWDGNDWTQAKPTTAPSARAHSKLVFDTVRQMIVLYGGYTYLGGHDTWTWDGVTWTLLDKVGAPVIVGNEPLDPAMAF